MGMKVLVSAPYMQATLLRFLPLFEVNGIEVVAPPVSERLSEEELLAYVGDVDGVVAGDDRFTRGVLEAASRLRVISKWGTGIDSIDLDACRARGITVCNTRDAFTLPVADSVLGYVLCFARRLPWMDRNLKNGTWEKIPGRSLAECTLGIIGVGHVGKAVARRARAFGMRILGHDVVDMPEAFLSETDIEMTSKQSLLEGADFVSLNCDLNRSSYHIIEGSALALMKHSGVLVNTARGPLVDEQALVRALADGRIAGAALDVFEEEPLPSGSPLRRFDNVMLAPHNSNSSPMAWERVHLSTIRQLLHALGAERIPDALP